MPESVEWLKAGRMLRVVTEDEAVAQKFFQRLEACVDVLRGIS